MNTCPLRICYQEEVTAKSPAVRYYCVLEPNKELGITLPQRVQVYITLKRMSEIEIVDGILYIGMQHFLKAMDGGFSLFDYKVIFLSK